MLIPGRKIYSSTTAMSAIGHSPFRHPGGGGGAVGTGLSPGGGGFGCLLRSHSPRSEGADSLPARLSLRSVRSRISFLVTPPSTATHDEAAIVIMTREWR